MKKTIINRLSSFLMVSALLLTALKSYSNPICSMTLLSAPGTDVQTVCINTPITDIVFRCTGGGSTVSGLPTGVNYVFFQDTVTISGTPTVSGSFTYTVSLTGASCLGMASTFTMTVNPDGSLLSSAGNPSQNVCINTGIIPIIYADTTAMAGGATVTGLPPGVTGNWNSSSETISGTPTVAGIYTYTVTLTNGACGTTTGTLTVLSPPTPSICEVSVDSIVGTNQYINVYWDKTSFASNIDSVFIYRYCPTSSGYVRLGAVANNSATLSKFTDVARSVCGPGGGDPTLTTYLYKISTHDTCGNESAQSLWHQSVNFGYNSGTSRFEWTLYQIEGSPVPVTAYLLMKDSLDNGNWVLRGQTSAAGTWLNDVYGNSPTASYRTDAIGFSCDATRSSISTTHSNIRHGAISVGIAANTKADNITIAPNPLSSFTTITFAETQKNTAVKVMDVVGNCIQQLTANGKQLNLDMSGYAKGIYFVQITDENKNTTNKKIIVE